MLLQWAEREEGVITDDLLARLSATASQSGTETARVWITGRS